VNSAWTPAVRPTEAGHFPTHARFGWSPPPFPADEDTSPLALVPRQRERARAAVVYALPDAPPDTPPRGLRKFDLGSVPASVTPPSTWRKAAWFAVGTSAAVVCGLAVAAVRLVGTPPESDTIDALPAFPTQELGTLPADETATVPTTSGSRTPSRTSGAHPDTARRTGDVPRPGSPDAGSPGSPGTPEDGGSTADPTTDPSAGGGTEPGPPQRTTIGPEPVTPTNPAQMGNRTEQYFALVTEDPQAAHELCTGGMAREGPEGIEQRYQGVDHVEVQQITIDRNQATTTSTVKIVRDDGTATVEQRQLTFTWGGNPKISDDAVAG
jgi:hypothetical protein